jgi:hypothetical protein
MIANLGFGLALEFVGPKAAPGAKPRTQEPQLTAGQATTAHQVAKPERNRLDLTRDYPIST